MKKLKQKLTRKDKKSGKKYFDWLALGNEAGCCFSGVPSKVTFLIGPLARKDKIVVEKPKKKRRIKRRQKTDDDLGKEEVLVPMETPIGRGQNTQTSRPRTNLSESEAHVKVLKTMLRSWCSAARDSKLKNNSLGDGEEGYDNEIDMIPFLYNPKSFTQTIENLLNFSHLVKKGVAGIRQSDEGIVYIRFIEKYEKSDKAEKEEEESSSSFARQAVLSVTMKDWRALVTAYDLKEGALPDRNYEQITTEEGAVKDNSDGELVTSSATPSDVAVRDSTGSYEHEEAREYSRSQPSDGEVNEKKQITCLAARNNNDETVSDATQHTRNISQEGNATNAEPAVTTPSIVSL